MPSKTLDDLPEDVMIEVRTLPKQHEIWIEAVDEDGELYFLEGEERNLFGVKVELLTDPQSGKRVWRVLHSMASQGWGPFVYDVALEVASDEDRDGLVTGTGLTDDSKAVWDFYRDHRSDVKRRPLAEDHQWIVSGKVDAGFPFVWTKPLEMFPKLQRAGRVTWKEGSDDLYDDQELEK